MFLRCDAVGNEMMRMQALCLFVSVVLSGCNQSKPVVSGGKPESGNPEQAVMVLERKTWELAKSKDKTAAASLMAEDFVDVGESGIVTRSKVLDTFGQATIS